MKLTISNQQITITEPLTLVSDTENVYEAEYEFGDEWDGFSRTAVFEGCGSTYQVVLTNTNKCSIPNEIIADSGYVRFGVLGTKVSGSITLRYPTVWSERVWVDVASIGTGTPSEPTAEVYAQILANEDAIEDRLDDAEDAIDTLEEEAHTHSNKALLDTYAQTEVDLASAVSLKHTHSNKSVLDAITSALVSAWTTASTWVTTNGATLLAHIADLTIHTTSSEKATWNAKSTVSVSASGSATDEIEYITVDGVQKKIKSSSGGTQDFEELNNRPKYNGSVMTGDTNIPEVPDTIITKISAGTGINTDTTSGQALISLSSEAQESLEKADTALQSVPNTYRTSAAQDVIDATKADASTTYTKTEVDNELADKVDKVTGKGLSTNDYDATEKANVASNTSARHSHSNKALLDTYTQTEADLASAVSNNHTHSNKSVLDGITSALVSAWNTASTWITTNGANVLSHITNTSNPHSVTASQVGLGNCNNTSDANKPISTATQTALDAKADIVKQTSISLTTAGWSGSASPYSQTITISGADANTKVDLQPSATILAQLIDDGVTALFVENNSGTLTCYAVGKAPTVAINNLQVTYYEVTSV